MSTSGPIGADLTALGEVVLRGVDDAGRFGQLELRGLITAPLSKSVAVGIGYARLNTYPRNGPKIFESIPFAQLNWALGPAFGGKLALRLRFEDRFQASVPGIELRARAQLRYVRPLAKHGPSAVVWFEPFVWINDRRATPRGLDQLRSFAGVSVPASRLIDVEIGYLNQYVRRPAGDRDNHAAVFNVAYRF